MQSQYDWLQDIFYSEGKKWLRKQAAKHSALHQMAHWAIMGTVPTAKQPKAKAIVKEISDAHQMLHSGKTGNALVRTIANATLYPRETIQAGLNYAYKSLITGESPPQPSETTSTSSQPYITPETDIQQWGWKFGIQWMGEKIAKLALSTPPTVLSYYSIYGVFPFTDQETAKQVKNSIEDISKKIKRRYLDEGIELDEPHLKDIAAKLLIFSYLYPTETAQGILDFAISNIASLTFEVIQEEKKIDKVQMPGAWIGGRGQKNIRLLLKRSNYKPRYKRNNRYIYSRNRVSKKRSFH